MSAAATAAPPRAAADPAQAPNAASAPAGAARAADHPVLDAAAVLADQQPSLEVMVMRAAERDPDPGLADLSDAALVRRVGQQAAAIAAATAEYLDLVAELVVRGIWIDHGARTPAQWLSHELGLGASTASEHVRVALRLQELPQTRHRLAAGRLSYCKARALTRIAVPELEDMLLMWADSASGAEIERIVSAYRGAARARIHAQHRAALDQPVERRWTRRQGADGRVTLTLTTDEVEAAEIEQLVDRLVQLEDEARGHDPDEVAASTPPTTRGAERIDALHRACQAAVDAGGPDTTGSDRHTLVVHVDADELAAPDDRLVAARESQRRVHALSARTLRRLACDAGMVIVARDGDGRPLDVGRRRREPTTAQRRALWARDGSCRFPGCDARRHLHAHHVRHWTAGGPTDLDNLVLLCGHHHRLVHSTDWDVVADRTAGRSPFRFLPPADARAARATARPGQGQPDPLSVESGAAALPPGEPDGLRPRHRHGPDDLDLDAAVCALEQELRRVVIAA